MAFKMITYSKEYCNYFKQTIITNPIYNTSKQKLSEREKSNECKKASIALVNHHFPKYFFPFHWNNISTGQIYLYIPNKENIETERKEMVWTTI